MHTEFSQNPEGKRLLDDLDADRKSVLKLLLNESSSRPRWPRGLRRRSAAAWLLGSRVRISLRAWMFVSCVSMLCCPV
jgi:hypothetical protein